MLLFTSLLLFRPLSVRYSKLDLMFLFTVNECTGDMDTNFTVKKTLKTKKPKWMPTLKRTDHSKLFFNGHRRRKSVCVGRGGGRGGSCVVSS